MTADRAEKPLHVIWRRPDGYHGAHPSDYRVLEIGDCKLWLHKKDREQFPFKISGGWGEAESTGRLNNLINALDEDDAQFARVMERAFHKGMQDDPVTFIKDKLDWIASLEARLKGDTWETEIMASVLQLLRKKVADSSISFQKLTNG
jgi:hypothetical protein